MFVAIGNEVVTNYIRDMLTVDVNIVVPLEIVRNVSILYFLNEMCHNAWLVKVTI